MGSTLAAFRSIAGQAGTSGARDLKREQCLAIAIRAAFPLPPTGAFGDLLAALDEAPSPPPDRAKRRSSPERQ